MNDAAAVSSLVLAAAFLVLAALTTDISRWLNSAGVILELGGVFHLIVSGLFDWIVGEYCSEKKYPFGPPWYINREIIDDPDTPVRTPAA